MNASVCVCLSMYSPFMYFHIPLHMYVCTAFFIDNAYCVQVLYSLFHVQYFVKCVSIH